MGLPSHYEATVERTVAGSRLLIGKWQDMSARSARNGTREETCTVKDQLSATRRLLKVVVSDCYSVLSDRGGLTQAALVEPGALLHLQWRARRIPSWRHWRVQWGALAWHAE